MRHYSATIWLDHPECFESTAKSMMSFLVQLRCHLLTLGVGNRHVDIDIDDVTSD